MVYELNLVKEIEKMAPRKHSAGREEYYEELENKCANRKIYRAILTTIFQCQELIKYSNKQRAIRRTARHDAKAKYESYKKGKERLLKLPDILIDRVTLKPEPAEWPRDHMGIGKGSVEPLFNERDEMVGIRPGSFKRTTPRGGRPEDVYLNTVFLMLDIKLREYRIRPRYEIMAELFYYFFDVGQKMASSYDADTVKREIMRLRHNKDLVARVEATLRKARAPKSGRSSLHADFPRKDSISF